MNKKENLYPIEVNQHRVIQRITLKRLFGDIVKAFNLERGIFRTIAGLLRRPGDTIRHFLNEGRHEQFHPVRFLLISTALSLFVFLAVGGQEEMKEAFIPEFNEGSSASESEKVVFQEVFEQVFYDYFNAMIWMFIPVMSLFSYLFYRKSTGYNYAENLVANTYVLCIGNLINTIFYCFTFYWGISITSLIATTLYVIYNVYAFFSFFHNRRTGIAETIVKAILVIVLSYIVYIALFSFIVGMIVGIKVGAINGG